MDMRNYKKPLLITGGVVFLLAIIIAGLALTYRSYTEGIGQTFIAHLYRAPQSSFPTLEYTKLTPLQRQIISISEQEYAKKPVSFDTTVMKYSQNNKESWCADYVSWVFQQAGQPFSNPNSGSWRIPGVATLQSYFQQQGSYRIAGNYRPKVGDVAIYRHDRSHTNIVIAVQNGQMTTIGGNETGHLRINVQPYTLHAQGLSGFGSRQLEL